MEIRDRIVELRRVAASSLRANPKNWREHPSNQVEALQATLGEIGWAGAALAYETDGALTLIDGHLRTEISDEAQIPVLILDVTPDEADQLLATLDPITAMATANLPRLDELLSNIQTDAAAINDLLSDIWSRSQIAEQAPNPETEWDDTLPEFINENQESYRQIKMHFENEQDVQEFAKKLGLKLTERTQFSWYPPKSNVSTSDQQYADGQ